MFMLNRVALLNPLSDGSMSAGDRRRALARDIAVPERAFAGLRVMPSRAAELAGLMRALMIDADRVRSEHHSEMHAMESACGACSAKRRCRRNLRNGKAVSRYRQYCPNAEQVAGLELPG